MVHALLRGTFCTHARAIIISYPSGHSTTSSFSSNISCVSARGLAIAFCTRSFYKNIQNMVCVSWVLGFRARTRTRTLFQCTALFAQNASLHGIRFVKVLVLCCRIIKRARTHTLTHLRAHASNIALAHSISEKYQHGSA